MIYKNKKVNFKTSINQKSPNKYPQCNKNGKKFKELEFNPIVQITQHLIPIGALT